MKGGLNAFGMAGLQKELSWVGAKIGSKPTKAKSSNVFLTTTDGSSSYLPTIVILIFIPTLL